MNLFYPRGADLSGGRAPEDCFIPLIPDATGLEAWRKDESRCRDYTEPSSSWCAPTAFAMIHQFLGKKPPLQDELFWSAVRAGVYEWVNDVNGYGPGWKGSYHAELARFIRSCGFDSYYRQGIAVDEIAAALDEGWFVIPSVSADIRFPKKRTAPAQRTGHVVLVYAYRARANGSRRTFYIQNCAGFQSKKSQIGVAISNRRMEQVFGGHATFVRPCD